MTLQDVMHILLWLLIFFISFQIVLRLVRRIYKFPIPHFLTNLIDNPIRRRIQPPESTPARHGIHTGMRVLEVGPGNGTYTLAASQAVGAAGRVVAIDIEPRIIERLQQRVELEGAGNIEVRVADVHQLPFPDASFDAIYMITVIGEIPAPGEAMHEFYRVLRHGGTLAFSEFLPDPDYSLPRTLNALAGGAGFHLRSRLGKLFYYTLLFEKCEEG
ncbi:MAG: class I SAM-dependent methyltransferase [Chloroflexota bacterium]|nr:class I SAM-dependent methyltransferase [Chloroflexota bacterium]